MFRSALRCHYRQYFKRQFSTSPTTKKSSVEAPSVGSSNGGGDKKKGSNFTRNIVLSLVAATTLVVSNASYQMRNDAKFANRVKENYPLVYQFLNTLEKVLPIGNFKLDDKQKSDLNDLYVAEDIKVIFNANNIHVSIFLCNLIIN